jgi:hypothetical protein
MPRKVVASETVSSAVEKLHPSPEGESASLDLVSYVHKPA